MGAPGKEKRPRRKTGLVLPMLFLLAALFPALTPPAAAAAFKELRPYPHQDSIILHPYDAEDATFALLETMRPFYRAAAGRDFTILGLPGRGGVSAWAELEAREADGYTLALIELTSLTLQTLQKHPPFNFDDFSKTGLLASAPLVLWAPAGSPLAGFYDLADQARLSPGGLTIAGAGSGTSHHLTSLRLDRQAGIKTAYRAYTGARSALRGALNGAALAFWSYPDPALLRLGCRPLALTSEKRHPLLPQAPTFLELGYDVLETSYFGLAMSGRVNGEISRRASEIFVGLARDREFQAGLAALGFDPAPLDAAGLAAFAQQLADYYRPLAEDYRLPGHGAARSMP